MRRGFVSVDPQLTISGLRSIRDVMSHSLSEQRLQTTLIGIFAGVALLLAAVGLYGLIGGRADP